MSRVIVGHATVRCFCCSRYIVVARTQFEIFVGNHGNCRVATAINIKQVWTKSRGNFIVVAANAQTHKFEPTQLGSPGWCATAKISWCTNCPQRAQNTNMVHQFTGHFFRSHKLLRLANGPAANHARIQRPNSNQKVGVKSAAAHSITRPKNRRIGKTKRNTGLAFLYHEQFSLSNDFSLRRPRDLKPITQGTHPVREIFSAIPGL